MDTQGRENLEAALKIGELDLLPIPQWKAYPTYFIGAGGMGFLTVSWLMYYFSQAIPEASDISEFDCAKFLTLDTAEFMKDSDLPPGSMQNIAENTLVRMDGDINAILEDVKRGLYPGIADFYPLSEETREVSDVRKKVGTLKDGAGTTRPFGRIGYFFNYTKIYNKLFALIKQPVVSQQMRYGGTFEILDEGRRCFFIVSSLAGGTGSSSFIDIAATLRKIQEENFSQENWIIIGVFTLAEVLAIDGKVDQTSKKQRMKANTYAALKELNHFMSGNSFHANYGEKGEIEVHVTNTMDQDSLFDLVFLVDTPNQEKRPLSGRQEVAQFLAQSMLLLGGSEISPKFFQRVVDTTALGYFFSPYPAAAREQEKTVEQQQFRFSTLGLCKLEIPVKKLLEYSLVKLSLEFLERLENQNYVDIPQAAQDIMLKCRLRPEDLDIAFEVCREDLFEVSDDLIGDLRRAQEPMDELRNSINEMVIDADHISEMSDTVLRNELQRIFPVSGNGDIVKYIDELLDEGHGNVIGELLAEIEKNLKEYMDRLRDELQVASDSLARRDSQDAGNIFIDNMLDNRMLNDMLEEMDHNWGPIRSRVVPGYRNRFLDEYEGAIQETASQMQDMQDRAFITSVWEYKIRLVENLIDNLQGLAGRYAADHFSSIRQNILDRCIEIEKALLVKHRFSLIALSPETYYERILPELLPVEKNILIESCIRDTQNEGIPVGEHGRLTPGQWSQYPPSTVAKAVMAFIMYRALPDFPFPDDADYESAPEYYKTDFNHSLFQPGTEFSQKKLKTWRRNAQMSLLFNGTIPEAQRYVISGCRTDAAQQNSWNRVLNLQGLTSLQGGSPNQALLLTLALGFPLTRLSMVKDWYSLFYLPMKKAGWLCHLFNEELVEMMTEPYLQWIELPDMEQARELYNEAIEVGIISELDREEETLVYLDGSLVERLPANIKNFFCESHPKSKTYPIEDMKEILQKNISFAEPLKKAIIAFKPGQEDEEKWGKRKERIVDGESIKTDDLLAWLEEAYLISKTAEGNYELNLNLFHSFSGTYKTFCEIFFERIVLERKITREVMISGLAQHQPLSRWITKRVVRSLISPEKLNKTRRRYQERTLPDYIYTALRGRIPN